MYKMLSLSVLFHRLPRHGTLELNNMAQNDSQLLLLVQLADAPCPRAPSAAMSHSYSQDYLSPLRWLFSLQLSVLNADSEDSVSAVCIKCFKLIT